MNIVESHLIDPSLVDGAALIAEKLTALEARVAELERCKHEDHTIGGEAVTKIASIVKADIAGLLHPQQQKETEG